MINNTPRPWSDDWNTCADPWKLACSVAGACWSVIILWTCSTAVPSATLGARLKEMVTAGSWPRCETVIGPTLRVVPATALS